MTVIKLFGEGMTRPQLAYHLIHCCTNLPDPRLVFQEGSPSPDDRFANVVEPDGPGDAPLDYDRPAVWLWLRNCELPFISLENEGGRDIPVYVFREDTISPLSRDTPEDEEDPFDPDPWGYGDDMEYDTPARRERLRMEREDQLARQDLEASMPPEPTLGALFMDLAFTPGFTELTLSE